MQVIHRRSGRRATRLLAPLVLALLAAPAACGGGGSGQGSDGPAAGGPAADLPVTPPSGPVDQELAGRGQELFRTRGCISCHTIGEGRRVGPDLEGLAERRDFAWTYHMITNPDSMLKNDSIASRLLGEYFTPMADQNVTPEQFRALYEYIRSESGGGGEDASSAPREAGSDDARGPAMAHRERRQHRQRQHHGCCGDGN